jgi:hypothetical protein
MPFANWYWPGCELENLVGGVTCYIYIIPTSHSERTLLCTLGRPWGKTIYIRIWSVISLSCYERRKVKPQYATSPQICLSCSCRCERRSSCLCYTSSILLWRTLEMCIPRSSLRTSSQHSAVFLKRYYIFWFLGGFSVLWGLLHFFHLWLKGVLYVKEGSFTLPMIIQIICCMWYIVFILKFALM